jgi:hypothetical protein
MNVFLRRLSAVVSDLVLPKAIFRAFRGLNLVLDSIDVVDPESLEASEVFDESLVEIDRIHHVN